MDDPWNVLAKALGGSFRFSSLLFWLSMEF
jgi:hypothetical protein